MIESSVIQCDYYQGNNTYVASIDYNLDYLTIVIVAETDKKIEIKFHHPIGFRCLDEGDLLNFWHSIDITNNWFLLINSGGWHEQEKKRDGFLSDSSDIKEYLIKGENDCVNILSTTAPTVSLI